MSVHYTVIHSDELKLQITLIFIFQVFLSLSYLTNIKTFTFFGGNVKQKHFLLPVLASGSATFVSFATFV